MNIKEIKKLIQTGESETIEFKYSLSDWRSILQTISAYANTKGGTLLIGVENNGKIKGIDIGKNGIESLVNKIIQNTDPKIYPAIETMIINGKQIIIISIKHTKNRPYLVFGKPYKRVGKTTHQMSRDEYERMILEKHKQELRFDNQICKGAHIENLDKQRVEQYLQRRGKIREIEMPKISFKQILVNLGILLEKTNAVTNGGILFFGNNPQQFIPYSEVKIARFKGTNMTDFIDRRELHGTLPEMIDEAEKFVKRNTRIATKIIGFEQVNITEYPYEAIRESITNAVCHRDYFFSGASIRVMIYDDKIVVESPGKLPEGVTLKNLEGSHVLRNEKIANWLYDIGYIEKWGTGIRRMKEFMRKHGLEVPKFEENGRFFRVTFFGPGEKILNLIRPDNRRSLMEMGLNNRQIEALKLMVNEGKVLSNKQYRTIFNVSRNTASNDLTLLIQKKLARKKGIGKGTVYEAM